MDYFSRKPTGFFDGHGTMICVGDYVLYDDGFLGFYGYSVEHDGNYGVYLDDGAFYSIQKLNLLDGEEPPGLDFQVLEDPV